MRFCAETVGKTGPRNVRRLVVPCEPVLEFSDCVPILARRGFRSSRQILIFGRTMGGGLRNQLGRGWVGKGLSYF